jgi:hypothetical protein
LHISITSAKLALWASTAVAQGSSTGELPPIDPRLELAARLMKATHKEDYIRRTYRTQLLQGMNFCHDAACQAALEKAVDVAANNPARFYVTERAKLLASRLSAPQLSAWVQFSESSDGQGIVAAEDTMTEDLARIGHQI